MSIINAKENRAITADSRRMEPLLNGFLMLILEITSSLNSRLFKKRIIDISNYILINDSHLQYYNCL